jgi:lipopolysaccharide transport system ATP-binding protein
MPDDVVIRVEGLGKKYIIGHQAERERYVALRDVLARGARNLWRKTADIACGRAIGTGDRVEEFWALKDVSFEVRHGEVLGIIGRNGAGKSTLLKILSRITEPSEGRVTIKGRVASLLEVGTGFHPELTGRENVYLNGSVLGMTRTEIRCKFDEIVAFADVEKFLDTPVKRYSSGMYVRLAFAIAAHLDPEILVVDEVLAVGDAEFKKKCLGKMQDVSQRGGRTVIFVSHDMGAMMTLCHRGLLLDHGRLAAQTTMASLIPRYISASAKETAVTLADRTDRSGDGTARLMFLKIRDANQATVISSTSCLEITIGYRSTDGMQGTDFLIGIYDSTNACCLYKLNSNGSEGFPPQLSGDGEVTCVTGPINLTPGTCFVNLALYDGLTKRDHVEHAGVFQVHYSDVLVGGRSPERSDSMLLLPQRWFA